jgi:hypothetical protein
MLPNYTPHRHQVPPAVARLSARLSGEATSVT